ncbi:membrane steroid-binding protein [Acrasis kona]|uniref:Membrane steroid-binding protein n=1 Tax=Acrasis kona TaxID=1008807 RepID=A0AAW2ZR29_9EUKA
MDFTTILILLAALVGGFFVYKNFFSKKKVNVDSDSDSDSDEGTAEEIEKKEFTLETLAKHNNAANKIYVSLKGIVYDVTENDLYAPDGKYNMFAGKDATYNLAKGTFDAATLNKMDLTGLKRSEKEEVDNYSEHYEMKYTEVGWLKEWKKSE